MINEDTTTDKATTDVAPPTKTPTPWGRIALFTGLFLVFLVVMYLHRKQTMEVFYTFRRGNPYLLGAAMVVQVVYWFTFAAMYKTSYAVVGLKSRIRDLLPVWLASLFINVAAPAAAPAVFIDEALRRGQSPAKATAGMLVLRLTDFGTLCVFIALGIVEMATRIDKHPWQSQELLLHCTALLGLIAVTLVWSGPLFLARWKPEALRALLKWVRGIINVVLRLFRRPELDENWAGYHASQFSQSADLALAQPVRLLAPAAVATLAHLLDMFSLHLVLQAFGIESDLGASLIAFSVCLLYWIVSPVPDGIGVVEFAVAKALLTIGIAQQHEATAAAIAFRGITLYLPVLIGGALYAASGGGREDRSC